MSSGGERALRAGWSGIFDGARGEGGWEVALAAQRWLAQPERGRVPAIGEVRGLFAVPASCAPAAAAGLEGLRISLLSLDAASAREWAALLSSRHGASPLETMASSLAQAWLAALGAEHEEASARAREASAIAAELGWAPVVIEAMVVRALAAESAGETAEALGAARRASRMAAAEGFPQSQYLANVVLARLRRLGGAGHLGSRILAALARVAPPSWSRWIGWESVLAGRQASEDQPVEGPAALLARLLGAGLVEGEARFDAAASALGAALPGWAPFALDAAAVLAALDPRRPADPELAAWREGLDSAVPPPRVRSVCADPTRPGGPLAYVLALPGRAGVRVAARGAPRWSAAVGAALDPTQGRTEVLLSTLALAGPAGIERDRLFRLVYGFEYRPELHRSVLKAQVHRARSWLGERGVLEHGEGALALELTRPVLIADPRGEHPLEERMLRQLASAGGAGSARDLAEALGLPLRSIQAALKHLVDDGAVQIERKGRLIEYRVEDTTFSEPTRF